jgi:hypothetical protein
MRNFQRACLLLLALGPAACTATMVNLPGGAEKPSAFAPVNETAPTAGLIKWSANGTSAALKARRQDAYRQMFAACKGSYRIDGEGPKQENGLVVPAAEGAAAAPAPYWYIQFSCVPKTTGGVAAASEEAVPPPIGPAPRTSPDPR